MFKKGFFSGVVVILLIMVVSIGAFGASVKKSIEVTYNSIKLVVDGKMISFGKDSAGLTIEPLIYNGTTYLPVRSIGKALDKSVSWDATTQTVFIGAKPGDITYMVNEIIPYAQDYFYPVKPQTSTTISLAGKTYNNGYETFTASNTHAIFNLDGQYSEISGLIGASGWLTLNDTTKFDIYLDGEFYQSIIIDPNALPENFIIPVKNVNQLKFQADTSRVNVSLVDVIIKK